MGDFERSADRHHDTAVAQLALQISQGTDRSMA